MRKSTGVNANIALRLLAQAAPELTTVKLAGELGVTCRTVRRWATGQYQPSGINRTKLRQLVADLAASEYHASTITRAVRLLEAAAEALMSDVDRAEQARFEQEMRDRQAAIVAAREAEQAQVARPSYRSITCDVDPFTLVNSEPALPF